MINVAIVCKVPVIIIRYDEKVDDRRPRAILPIPHGAPHQRGPARFVDTAERLRHRIVRKARRRFVQQFETAFGRRSVQKGKKAEERRSPRRKFRRVQRRSAGGHIRRMRRRRRHEYRRTGQAQARHKSAPRDSAGSKRGRRRERKTIGRKPVRCVRAI